jgi:NADH:ubiquinone oxidoreductase subunit 3 (subunit A)
MKKISNKKSYFHTLEYYATIFFFIIFKIQFLYIFWANLGQKYCRMRAIKIEMLLLGTMGLAFNSSTWEPETDLCEFEVSQGHIVKEGYPRC